MNSNNTTYLSSIIKAALREDRVKNDLTTRSVIKDNSALKAVIIAKENGVVCGIDIANLVFKAVDRKIKFKSIINDGNKIKKGQILAKIRGPARGILSAERTALNFLGLLCGIATRTRLFVDMTRPYNVKILDTRKTLPGLRALEKYAVRIAGGHNHRCSLEEMVLIKDNHLKALSIKDICLSGRQEGLSIKKIIKSVKKNKKINTKIEIEVKNLKEFREALEARPDIIMLDNMKITDIRKAVLLRRRAQRLPAVRQGKTLLEVSGNISLDNVKKYARCGIDFISIGGLTKDIQSLDVSLEFK